MSLHGIIPAVGTPLMDEDRVDEAGLRRLVRYVLDGGVHGVFANGSMGGFAFLTDDEQVRSVAITVSAVADRVPVIGGVGETSTSRAIRLARRIAAEGVDYLSVLPPFYFFATQEHLIDYFGEIAAATPVPVFLYDNPVLTKNKLEVETIIELKRRIPTLAGIKVSDSDCAKLQAIVHSTREHDDFPVITGSEFLIVVALQMGCAGAVGGLHNLCPHLAVALWDAYQAGDLARARSLQQDMIETWQIFRYGAIWGAFDEALRYLGICERATGRPYITVLDNAGRDAVHRILDRYVKPYLSAAAGPAR
ncbi:MAG TPA: dihydrodipicolinate synthase family protein [Bryobacteraceae bacterium]|nr:dihydrodipicolinate synthase family protein [Bryobacteraceae bacterium]